MSDYTPTTRDVKARYMMDEFGYSFPDDPCPEFDRWLEAVKAEAVQEYLDKEES